MIVRKQLFIKYFSLNGEGPIRPGKEWLLNICREVGRNKHLPRVDYSYRQRSAELGGVIIATID